MGLHRLVFGQPRQDVLLDYLQTVAGNGMESSLLDELQISLDPDVSGNSERWLPQQGCRQLQPSANLDAKVQCAAIASNKSACRDPQSKDGTQRSLTPLDWQPFPLDSGLTSLSSLCSSHSERCSAAGGVPIHFTTFPITDTSLLGRNTITGSSAEACSGISKYTFALRRSHLTATPPE